VTAAAGGTGLAAVDLAANVFGCTVIAACGSDEKCQVAMSKGAYATINYSRESLKEKMKEITDGEGANAIFECVGGKLFRECLSR
jgi:NADPH2:quinone reductase